MRPDRGDLVDLVEVDGLAVSGGSTPAAEPDGATPRGRPDARGWIAALGVLSLVAIGAGTAAIRTRPAVRLQVDQVVIDGGPGGADAAGCPPAQRCALRLDDELADAVRAGVPGTTVLTATSLYDVTTFRAYRRELVATVSAPAGSSLRVTTQCFPGGVVTGGDPPVASGRFTDPSGRRFLWVEKTAVAPFSGCSAFVRAEIPAEFVNSSGGLTAAVLGLAADPGILTYR